VTDQSICIRDDPDARAERRWEFVFVLEQALGHVVHAMNIERVLGEQTDICPTVIPIAPDTSTRVRGLPLVRNWSLQSSLAARQALHRHITAHSPDAVFVHTQVASLLSVDVMRSVPTIVSLDATPMNFDVVGEAYGHNRQAGFVEAAKRSVTRRALSGADAIVTWSRWAAASAVDDYGVAADRVHPIAPGVDLQRLRPRTGTRDDGPVRLLFVGGDFERKGGFDLLEAMRILNRPVELDVVSSSVHAPADLPVRVHAGVAANSSLLTDLFRRADVFVLPSRGDCTPLAVGEALACGLPIVATAVGAMPELVHHGENGFIVPTRDPGQLASALTTLIDQPQTRRMFGHCSRRLALAEHDVDKNCRAIFDLMAEIATARSRAVGGTARTTGQ
jgi:glycosyltransferase involved in cell wall biosynthesis